ncbi:MAG TPA: hypothetical protein VMP68_31330 [Candidatus Eisenbacteria bacterium]|nr:hypothetical protein [Candidatus Eisenbacteria bacterium]
MKRLNGIFPPIGTIVRGHDEAYTVRAVDDHGVELSLATLADYRIANARVPAEVHSVYEHTLIMPQRSPFGPIRVLG